MFGHNEIVGRKFFAGRDDLMVTSVFHTLQCEGPFAGRPAVFVRLSRCNLACSFCDTSFEHGQWMTRDALVDAMITAVQGPGALKGLHFRDKVLVITGGEPMLQYDALLPFLVSCSGFFAKVQIESNGLLRGPLPDNIVLVISPKCIDNHYARLPYEVMKRANCLKFVITANASSPYNTVPEWAFDWRKQYKRPVYVMPMAQYTSYPATLPLAGGDLAQRSAAERVSFWEPGLLHLDRVRANHEYAATYALEHGLYLTLQMQLFTSLP